MAYARYVYNRINWLNKSESLATPLGKTNLNRMDSAIYNIAENLDVVYNEMSTGKIDKSDADKLIVGMPTWNKDTGVFTIHFYDGSVFQIDFNIEKIPVSFSMDSAGVITMTTADGTEWTADIGDVMPTYTYEDSDTIVFSDTKDGDYGHIISAEVKKNSITGDHLQPDYLSDVTKQASNAKASAKSASDYADNAANDAKLAQSYAVGGSGIREGENEDCAKAYKEKAEQAAEEAGEYLADLQSVQVTGVKGSNETTYRKGNVNITPENIGLGNVQNYKAVSTVESQGLSDTEKANARANIGAGMPVAVKGNAETSYRTGNVNLTPANIGAAPTSHASSATTYGVSTASNYGHAMASSTTPKANGTAAVGTETAKFARGDHVHPLQTSVSGSSGSCTGNAATATKAMQDGNGNNIANTYLPKSGGTMTGTLTVGSNSILFQGTRVVKSNNTNGIEFYRTDGSGTGYAMWINNGGNDEFTPRKDGGSILGRANARWGQIYSTNSAISTSDRRMKHNISYIGKDSNYDTAMTDDQLEDFMMGLKACTYRLNDGTSGRPHHGFIAQDIEELMERIGLDDHAAFIKSPKTKDVEVEKEIEEKIKDPHTGEAKIVKKIAIELQHEEIPGEYIYSLRYEEFIADIIRFVQIQKDRADNLEERLVITEQKNLEMEKRLEALEQLIK